MPKTINLVGQVVSEENFKIGLRVEASKNWKHGNQGEGGVGTITGLVDSKTEYGLEYNFATVRWDNDEIYNYPLNEENCLTYSNGKVKKTAVSKFLEKAKLWDVFKVVKSEYDLLQKGKLFQIIEIKTRSFTVQMEAVEGIGADHYEIDSSILEKLNLRKQTKIEEKVLALIEGYAEYVETPKKTKDGIIAAIKAKYSKDIREFLFLHNSYVAHPELDDRVKYMASTLGIQVEGTITVETILAKGLYLERVDRVLYTMTNATIRNYISKNISDGKTKMTYKEWVSVLDTVNNKTLFTDALRKVILLSNCNEKLKNYFQQGQGKTDENFIDFDRASKKIQYTPKGKDVALDGRGNPSGVRQTMSPHKFFGKYFKDVEGVTEYEVKCFADEVISTFGEYKMIEIQDGKIGEFYSGLKTITSCMTGKSKSLFALYDDNPDVFKMFAITLNGEVVGRTIRVSAFTADKGEPFVYFDRLYYGGNEEVVQWFNSYCTNNKLTRKNENSVGCLDTFYNKEFGGKFSKRIYVPIKSVGAKDFEHLYRKVPYLDTLRYGMFGVLTNRPDKLTVKDKFVEIPYRYVFDRADNEYGTRGYSGYCAVSESWTTDDLVTITDAEGKYAKFVGRTVRMCYAIKTEKGFTIK